MHMSVFIACLFAVARLRVGNHVGGAAMFKIGVYLRWTTLIELHDKNASHS